MNMSAKFKIDAKYSKYSTVSRIFHDVLWRAYSDWHLQSWDDVGPHSIEEMGVDLGCSDLKNSNVPHKHGPCKMSCRHVAC